MLEILSLRLVNSREWSLSSRGIPNQGRFSLVGRAEEGLIRGGLSNGAFFRYPDPFEWIFKIARHKDVPPFSMALSHGK
jgi:hypothetical protein